VTCVRSVVFSLWRITKIVVPFFNHFCIFFLINSWTSSRSIYDWNILFAAEWIRVMMLSWLASDRWFSPVFSTNKTDRHDTTEILFKVVLSIITLIHSAANNMFQSYIERAQPMEGNFWIVVPLCWEIMPHVYSNGVPTRSIKMEMRKYETVYWLYVVSLFQFISLF
jgi:hypothetical protein